MSDPHPECDCPGCTTRRTLEAVGISPTYYKDLPDIDPNGEEV